MEKVTPPYSYSVYLNRGIFSHFLFAGILSFALGVLAAGWNRLVTFIVVLVAYELILLVLFPLLWYVHIIGAAMYIAGWFVGSALFPCNRRQHVFNPVRHPWTVA